MSNSKIVIALARDVSKGAILYVRHHGEHTWSRWVHLPDGFVWEESQGNYPEEAVAYDIREARRNGIGVRYAD